MTPQHRELLDLMKPLRDALSRVRATALEFDETKEVQRAIDRFAVKLTGDHEYFWARPSGDPRKRSA